MKRTTQNAIAIPAILTLFALAGCGGGGSSSSTPSTPAATPVVTPVTSANSFALQSAFKKFVASGATTNYTISDFCTGTATSSISVPVAATFEGVATAISVTTTETATFTASTCTPTSDVQTRVEYYDSNYNPLGHAIAGVEYSVYAPAATALPTSVKVGDTAIIGTETNYSDSSKKPPAVVTTRQASFVIEADTATTAIVNFISKPTATFDETRQTRYRIDAAGTLTPVSIDRLYKNSAFKDVHMLYTAK